MITIQGMHNTALCYTSGLEDFAAAQIRSVCDQEAFSGHSREMQGIRL